MRTFVALWSVAALALSGCAGGGRDAQALPIVRTMETAHGVGAWQDRRALQAQLLVIPLDGPPLRAVMTLSTDGACARLDMDNAAGVTFDGAHAWVWPAGNTVAMPRYQVRTWPYLAAIPFRLEDSGTNVTDMGKMPLLGRQLPAAKVAFAPGVADAPDEWYILYGDPQTGRLAAVAYASGHSKLTAVPRCIVFDRYQTIDGVTFATGWTFYHWSTEKGPYGPPTGNAILAGLRFVDPPEYFFDKPVMAWEDPALSTP